MIIQEMEIMELYVMGLPVVFKAQLGQQAK
jgi:hypothetical protein